MLFRSRYGPVSVLPTRVFFYGMKPGEVIDVEMERGKSLVVALTAIGETDEEGNTRVFFELNGQPRFVSVADRKSNKVKVARRTAQAGNDNHVPAPMPGLVVILGAAVGQQVNSGDHLVTLEAMKMETSITAPCSGTVESVEVKVGDVVEAKDLLVVIRP